jgi:DNA-binding transcriptional LysR family regulator
MAEWAGELTRAAEQSEVKPSGVVRITTPPGLAFDLMAPFAVWLKKKLPEIALEVVSTVHYLDLVRREADLALRFQRPTQRDLVVVQSIAVESAAFASRRYIESLPKGYGIADVDWIGWAPPFEHLPPNPQLAARMPGFRPVFASDDFLVQLRAAEEGAGAIFLARVKHRFSGKTNLEELDLDFGQLRSETCLVCAKSALEIPRVRAVADLLAAELGAATVWPSPHKKVKPSAQSRAGRR